MTPRTARVLHAAVTALELLAGAMSGLLLWLASSAVVAVVGRWPGHLQAITGAYLAAAGARLSFEAPRAWRAIARRHAWAHRNIRNRTAPQRSRSRDLVPTAPQGGDR